jgi:hypothetical protein
VEDIRSVKLKYCCGAGFEIRIYKPPFSQSAAAFFVLSNDIFHFVITFQRNYISVARLGPARHGTVRHGTARLGSAWLGSARLGSAQLGSARLGSARLGSAQLSSAQHSS